MDNQLLHDPELNP